MDLGKRAEEEIIKAAEDNIEALRNGDMRFLERNLSDNFVGIGPSGSVLTRQEWLAGHSPSSLKYLDFRLQDKTIRIHESSVAILTARRISRAEIQGRLTEGDFRVTEVYVNQEGRWLLANLQLSPIQQPPQKPK
jgi:hypothetical protein